MKRILSVFLALALMASMTTVAFAEKGKKAPDGQFFSGVAPFDGNRPLFVSPGDTIELDIDYFYGSWKEKEKEYDSKLERDVTVTYTYDNEDYPIGALEKDYHRVAASWTSGGQYIEGVNFEDGDSYVTIQIKGGIGSTVDQKISGTIKIVEENIPNRPKVTYECKIKKGTVIIEADDQKSEMISWGDREFRLPHDYQERQVRFVTEDGESYGTFVGEFKSGKSGKDLAEFRVRVSSQSPLFLGFSELANRTVESKYPNADLRFINWTARPTFAREGTLSIYMDPDEYKYGINSDNTLYRLGGAYDEDDDAYVISTKTLGSYVISDIQLSAGSGAAATTPSSSSSVSSAPPSSAASPSSAAPQTSYSSAAPSSSSEESSSESDEDSSEPEDSVDEESSSSSSISRPDDGDDDDEDGEKNEKKKKFPLVPVLLGVLGVAILVLAVVVVGNRSGGRKRSRRRRYDDDWDD